MVIITNGGHCYIIVRLGDTIPLDIINIIIAMGMNTNVQLYGLRYGDYYLSDYTNG